MPRVLKVNKGKQTIFKALVNLKSNFKGKCFRQ